MKEIERWLTIVENQGHTYVSTTELIDQLRKEALVAERKKFFHLSAYIEELADRLQHVVDWKK